MEQELSVVNLTKNLDLDTSQDVEEDQNLNKKQFNLHKLTEQSSKIQQQKQQIIQSESNYQAPQLENIQQEVNNFNELEEEIFGFQNQNFTNDTEIQQNNTLLQQNNSQLQQSRLIQTENYNDLVADDYYNDSEQQDGCMFYTKIMIFFQFTAYCFFASAYYPNLRSNHENCVMMSYWAYANAAFISLIPFYLIIFVQWDKIKTKKGENYDYKKLAQFLYFEDMGIRFMIMVSFLINLGMTLLYQSSQNCFFLTFIVGMYMVIYWLFFSMIVYINLKMIAEGEIDAPDINVIMASI